MQGRDQIIGKTLIMLRMQDDMNRRVDIDWIKRDRAWNRAIWIECAELMEHYGGWKWWKQTACDLEQSILEIVDIWHFGLSLLLQSERKRAEIAEEIFHYWNLTTARANFQEEVERLALLALSENKFAVDSVRNLLTICGKDFDDMYRLYIGKNVLNLFRQDQGYREGTYVKNWNGEEDNQVLARLLVDLDSNDERFPEKLMLELEGCYDNVERPTTLGQGL